jgi:hypothetical protein
MVRQALAVGADVPYPDFRRGPLPGRKILLELARAKSEAQYAKGTRQVQIYREDRNSSLLVTPCLNGGAKNGFTEMPDAAISLPAGAADADLGGAVRAALLLATGGTVSSASG